MERTIKKDIDAVATFEPIDYGRSTLSELNVTERQLQIVVPDIELSASQIQAINSAIDYGKSNGVNILIVVGR